MAKGKVVWFIGLSGSGKSTLSASVAASLATPLSRIHILDADIVRGELCADLGFSMGDRRENVRRMAYVAKALADNGVIVLVAAICPLNEMQEMVRERIPDVVEVFVDAPLGTCELRDPKGLYKRARKGHITLMSGIDSPFEKPLNPAIICYTAKETIQESTLKVLAFLNGGNATGERPQLRRKTIAVDFDGVIANYSGWKGDRVFGSPRPDVLTTLRILREEGWKIVVFSTRAPLDIADYLLEHRIPYDDINRNDEYENKSGKPVATVYWDDRALHYSGDAILDLPAIRSFRTWSGRE